MPLLHPKKAYPWNPISLTTLLTVLVSISVLITLTILLIATYHSKKESLIDTTLTLNYTSAIKMSQTVDSLFKSMRNSLRYSAHVLSNVDSMSPDEVSANLELLRQSSNYFNSIAVVDETGHLHTMSPKLPGLAGKTIRTLEAKAALASRKPYISKPYVTSTSKRLIVFMSEPIFDKHGRYRGYIGGTIYIHEKNVLHSIFENNPTNKIGSYFYIVASNGELLYHPDKSRLGMNISANQVVGKLIQGRSGYEQMVNLKGESLLAGYVKVPENGWGVVVVSPISAVYDELNHDIKTTLLYMLLPFTLLMLVVVLLARGLAKPFVALADFVSKIGKEKVELPEGQRHWNREANLLTEAIRYAVTDITKQTAKLTHEAMTDPLTGVTNRRTFEAIMHRWMEEHITFSIIIMDLDKFKSINDTYGHQAGDDVLKYFANIITSSVRPGDVCCRFGGEEFIALIPHATAEEAYTVAERIRNNLEKGVNPIGQPITVTQGISHYPSHSDSAQVLIHLADQALYRAKEAGRNQTMIADFLSMSK